MNKILLFPFFLSVPPQIHHFDFGDDPINSGDMAVVNCAVIKGDLPVKIHWLMNGQSLSTVDGINVMQTKPRLSQLSIDNVQGYHSGEFKCMASNKAGNATQMAILNVNGIE